MGGHDIQYDEDLQIFYHNPLRSTWIYSFSSSQWRKGPDLPETGCAKGTLFLDKGKLVYSGGARLRVNRPGESNQIYEYLPNATVYVLDTESAEGQWEVIKSIQIFIQLQYHSNQHLLVKTYHQSKTGIPTLFF